MGHDLELFIHPERISSELICPICTQVLQHPVQTPTEHLFCEEELLEWMSQSSLCPVTQTELDPTSIRKPGRVIMNMLGELEMYCPNKQHGCKWEGTMDTLDSHLHNCECKPRELILEELLEKDHKIKNLMARIKTLENDNDRLKRESDIYQQKVERYEKKLRVYDAFLLSDSSNVSSNKNRHLNSEGYNIGSDSEDDCGSTMAIKSDHSYDIHTRNNDIDKLHRLQQLNSLSGDAFEMNIRSVDSMEYHRKERCDAQKALATQSIGRISSSRNTSVDTSKNSRK